jgi:hypothetical protein
MNSHVVAPLANQAILEGGNLPLAEGEPSGWRATSIAAYANTVDVARRQLGWRLAGRLRLLTGSVPSQEGLVVDMAGRSASAVVDGVLFLLRGDELVMVRPCAHCGVGRFVSEPLVRQADLGYALAVWTPHHRDCEPADPPDDVSW